MGVRRGVRVWRFMAVLLGLAIGLAIPGLSNVEAQDQQVWFSNVLWYPSLEEAGIGLAEIVNQIDAACNVDVDPVTSTNGAGSDGPVYGFAVSWNCLPGSAPFGVDSWYSTMLWRPTIADTGIALAEILNQIDGSCTVDIDPVLASNGSGPEGPVYALAVTWACRQGAPQATGAWLSNIVWEPTFGDAGIALAGLVNQIEAGCAVDVDQVVATNGAAADGPIVAFAVSWSCPV
jgi:hypothetical protein